MDHSSLIPTNTVHLFNVNKNLDFNNIAYLSADINYTTVHFANGQRSFFSYTMKRFEEILAENTDFIRIHKAYLINKNYIAEMSEYEVLMCCGKQLPIARRRRFRFKAE